MKSYLSIIPILAKKNKKQSIMTIVCIIFSVFLVTSIFSMADMASRMEKERILYKHGNWHIMVHDMSEEEYAHISESRAVKYSSMYDVLNYEGDEGYFVNGKIAHIYGLEADFTKMVEGLNEYEFPKNDNEVVISSNMKNTFNIEKGEKIVLNTPNGDVEYTVCGVCSNSELFYLEDSVGIFLNKEAFKGLCDLNGISPRFANYILLNTGFNVRNSINNFKDEFDLSEENIAENTALLGIMGMSINNSMTGLYIMCILLSVMILLAGVFMISGSINTGVARRTQFFGMLRCIGASKKQVMRIVRLEALNWCKVAVPVGVLTGVFLSWILCLIVRFGVAGEFSNMPIFGISEVGIISGAFIGVLTVLFAASLPARRAAKVSPMTAAMGNSNIGSKSSRVIGGNFRVEVAMGISHAISAKKNMFLMTGSFTLSIVLFLCFSAVLSCIENALPAMRPSAPDLCVMSYDRSNSVGSSLLGEIGEMKGVRLAFGRMFMPAVDIKSDKGVEKVDLISYEENQLNWAREDVLKGEIKDVLDGKGIAIVCDSSNPLSFGDKIEMFGEEIEVLVEFFTSPFDNVDGVPIVICSEEMFKSFTGVNDYAVIDIQLDKGVSDSDIANIREAIGEGFIFSDRFEKNKDTVRTYIAFRLFVYGFLFVIALISVFNVINSMAMSTSAKLKEYGAMRAVGMEFRQIKRMILAEAFSYTFCGTVIGCLVGIPLHKFCYEILVTEHFGNKWGVPFGFLGIIVLFMFLATVLSVHRPVREMKRMTVVDTMNGGW